jgi:ribose 5-phosphate isomerase A
VRAGGLKDIVGVACSRQVEAEARRLGLPVADLDDRPVVDLTIDGADEVDPALRLIKGGGGALLREKIVAQASRREVIVVDETKLSDRLGTRMPVPVEAVPFGLRGQIEFLRGLGGTAAVRAGADGRPFVTDGGNRILDCAFGPIADPEGLAAALGARAGIVEHGLFLGLAAEVVVAGPDGVRRLRRP